MYLANWKLIERDEQDVLARCRESEIPLSSVRIERDRTGLALLVTCHGRIECPVSDLAGSSVQTSGSELLRILRFGLGKHLRLPHADHSCVSNNKGRARAISST